MRLLYLFLGTITLLSGTSFAQPVDPILYEAKLPKETQQVNGRHLFFSIGPNKWLIVGKYDLYSWVWEEGSMLQKQPPLSFQIPFTSESYSGKPEDVQGFVQKDGGVVLVWRQQSEIPGGGVRKHFIARYKQGKWSAVQFLPGQTESGTYQEVVADDKGHILVFWQQLNKAFDADENVVKARDIPSYRKSLAWYYSVITETEIRPAQLIPGQQNTNWSKLLVLPDLKHQRIAFVLADGGASTQDKKTAITTWQILYGFWKDSHFEPFQQLTTEGHNVGPSLMKWGPERLAMVWAYKKGGFFEEENDQAKRRPFAMRYAVLEAEAIKWGPVYTLPNVKYIPRERDFITTPEGGLFTGIIPHDIKETVQEFRTVYIAPDGSALTQAVPTASSYGISWPMRYVVAKDGKIMIVIGEFIDETTNEVKLYTTTWHKGKLAPLSPFPQQGRGMREWDLQLRMGANEIPLLARFQTSAQPIQDGSKQEIYTAYGEGNGFTPTTKPFVSSDPNISFLGLVGKPGTTSRLSWQGGEQNHAGSFRLATWKNNKWSKELEAEDFVLHEVYINAKGQQLFFLDGGNKLATVFCEKEKCAPIRVWNKPHPKGGICAQTLTWPSDGSLAISWLEWESGAPRDWSAPSSPHPLPLALHMVRFPNFKATDLYQHRN